jgi:hypothetical protein
VPPPKRLKGFPRHRVIPHELLRCEASELDLLTSLGEPTGQTDPHHTDPRFFWDLEWPCGLVTAVELSQLTETLVLHLNRADVEHALRHLGIVPRRSWLWESDAPAAFAAVIPDPPERDWDLWHQGEDGQRQVVATGLTEPDARCQLDELEQIELRGVDGGRPRRRFGVARSRPEAASPAPTP